MTHRKVEIVRGMWGLAALLRPRTVLHALQGDPNDRASQVTMRVLGARQLSQAVLSGVSPTAPVLAVGVWVDAVHALTAAGLAALRPKYAAPALADAAIAGTWAGVGRHDLLTGEHAHGEEVRSQLACAVLGVVPGGRPLLDAARRTDLGRSDDGAS
jgi:hypothetical protein